MSNPPLTYKTKRQTHITFLTPVQKSAFLHAGVWMPLSLSSTVSIHWHFSSRYSRKLQLSFGYYSLQRWNSHIRCRLFGGLTSDSRWNSLTSRDTRCPKPCHKKWCLEEKQSSRTLETWDMQENLATNGQHHLHLKRNMEVGGCDVTVGCWRCKLYQAGSQFPASKLFTIISLQYLSHISLLKAFHHQIISALMDKGTQMMSS